MKIAKWGIPEKSYQNAAKNFDQMNMDIPDEIYNKI